MDPRTGPASKQAEAPVPYWVVISRLQEHPSYPGLSGSAVKVLLNLVKHTDHRKPKGSAFPSVATISAETGTSPRSVKRALSDLKRFEFIRLERRRRSKDPRRRGVGRYSVLPLLPDAGRKPSGADIKGRAKSSYCPSIGSDRAGPPQGVSGAKNGIPKGDRAGTVGGDANGPYNQAPEPSPENQALFPSEKLADGESDFATANAFGVDGGRVLDGSLRDPEDHAHPRASSLSRKEEVGTNDLQDPRTVVDESALELELTQRECAVREAQWEAAGEAAWEEMVARREGVKRSGS